MKNLLIGVVLCTFLGGCGNTPPASTPTPGSGKATSTAAPSSTPSASISGSPTATVSVSPSQSVTPSATPKAEAVEWKEYKAEDGSFSIMIPGEPTIDKSGGGLKVAGSIDEKHAFVASKDKMDEKKLDKFTEEAAKTIVETLEKDGNKVTKHEIIDVAGHSGLDIVMTNKDGDEIEMCQVLNGKTLYQLLSIRAKGAEPFNKEDEEKFASSFKILK